MSVIDTFKKQGGLQLLKRYAKSGVLFTALAELLVLGKNKKALEILRLSADCKTKLKLEKNMLISWECLMQSTMTTVRIFRVIKLYEIALKKDIICEI